MQLVFIQKDGREWKSECGQWSVYQVEERWHVARLQRTSHLTFPTATAAKTYATNQAKIYMEKQK